MTKFRHEIRDPVHNFIRIDTEERKILDSAWFQRLRHIHQLGLTYLLYPGAAHRRFEHSLGTMEFATRIFDIITRPENLHDEKIREIVPSPEKIPYWRRVLRMAALLHDVGHLPFSHAGEKLLPEGWTHEHLTAEIIKSSEMKEIWEGLTPPLRAEDIAKVAVGPRKLRLPFSDWETILSEIISGDSFGADRMDYLLRDSHHAGVLYGRFDYYRLIDTIRILPRGEEGSNEPMPGVEGGGLHSCEGMILARYFMYLQVCWHPVRIIHDLHLEDFMKEWLPAGQLSTNLNDLVQLTDNEVMAAMLKSAREKDSKCHEPASRIIQRRHYKVIYQPNPEDLLKNPEAPRLIFAGLCTKYSEARVKYHHHGEKEWSPDFPVFDREQRVASSLSLSQPLAQVPLAGVDYLY